MEDVPGTGICHLFCVHFALLFIFHPLDPDQHPLCGSMQGLKSAALVPVMKTLTEMSVLWAVEGGDQDLVPLHLKDLDHDQGVPDTGPQVQRGLDKKGVENFRFTII